jgi:SAM-dependent methyltransferase
MDRNLAIYRDPKTVREYAINEELAPPEPYVFYKYIPNGIAILDLGVGGGRTTRFLAPCASRYAGVDYAMAMVETCREKYPSLELYCEDARDLSRFSDESFDVVLFSFNGLDNLPSESDRLACLREMKRVVRNKGYVIFSSHNARWIVSRPNLEGANLVRQIWRTSLAVKRSLSLLVRSLKTGVLYRSSGYTLDPVHGGLLMYSATPDVVERQLNTVGLRLVETINPSHPKKRSTYLTAWYYYVATRCDYGLPPENDPP